MIKDNIIYYTKDRVPMSLRELELKPDCDGRIEYIFYAVNVAQDFDELTAQLQRILAMPFVEVARKPNYIVYEVQTSWGDINSLKIKIKEKVEDAEEL